MHTQVWSEAEEWDESEDEEHWEEDEEGWEAEVTLLALTLTRVQNASVYDLGFSNSHPNPNLTL